MGQAKLIRQWGLVFSVIAAVLIAPSVALAAGDANQAGCAAKTETSPGYRLYLPDCRAYELVTPPYKEGGVVLDELGAVSTDGSRVIVGAGGAFAGADNLWFSPVRNPGTTTYEFARGADDWQSTALTPPASEYSHSALMAVSAASFETTLWSAQQMGLPYHENIYLRTGPNKSEFNLIGPGTPWNEKGEEILANELLEPTEVLHLVGASRDLSHSLFAIRSSNPAGNSDLWVGDTTELHKESLYEYLYTGAANSEPILVGIKNNEALHGSSHINEHAELISNCGTELGSGGSGEAEAGQKGSVYNAVSSNGEAIFFTALACSKNTPPEVDELYARIGSQQTVAISEPSKADCEACDTTTGLGSATFEGASQSGEKVFFTTAQELLPGQTGENLYEYDFGGPMAGAGHPDGKISLISGGSSAPEVQGVVRVSENGERVYFVAKSVLTSQPDLSLPAEHQVAEAGADNLYVYEPEPGHPGSYRTVFVATLLTPGEEVTLTSEEAVEEEAIRKQANRTFAYEVERAEMELFPLFINGEFEQYFELLVEAEEAATETKRAFIQRTVGARGPSGTLPQDQLVWQTADSRPAQTTPNGDVLVFPSSAKLTLGDTSSVPQLFMYNANAESLTRVSIGQTGPASGNVKTFRDAPQIPIQRFGLVGPPTAADTGLALAAGGSRIFFASAAELAPGAEHNAVNVYEYSDGRVYLISGGGDASLNDGAPSVSLLGADPSGQDAFFLSEAKLVPQYGDTQVALYDARAEGGFPAPVLEPGCLGETCRGASGMAPAGPLPGSAGQAGGGNVSAGPSTPEATGSPTKTRSRLLAKALKGCRSKRARKRRATCEAGVRRRYGKGSSASRAHRSARAAGAKREAGR